MEQENRWTWIKVPGNEFIIFNDFDALHNRQFCVIDNNTHKKYYLKVEFDSEGTVTSKWHDRYVTIPEELKTQDFINWVVSTSYEFIKYMPKELITPEVINILLASDKASYIDVFGNASDEQWYNAIEKYPDIFIKMPDKYRTHYFAKKYASTHNSRYEDIPTRFRSKEIFTISFNSNDDAGKIRLINLPRGKSWMSNSKQYYDVSFITQEMAAKLLDINLNTIDLIPAKYISVAKAKEAAQMNGKYLKYVPLVCRDKVTVDKAFETNPIESITYIPEEFQTIQKQKKLIDLDVINISLIPDEYLFNQTIDYALSKNVSIFSNLPLDRKTPERCNLVVSISGTLLNNVPKKYRTPDLCMIAITTTPTAIRYVPEEILTQQFYDKVISKGIVIPNECMKYVNKCLDTHKKLLTLGLETSAESEEIERKISDQEWSNISINNVPGFFVNPVVRQVLNDLEIFTLGDFFIKSMDPNFISNFGIIPKVIKDIYATIRLLKCKYFGSNPGIEFDDNMPLEEIIDKFGFSTRVESCLKRIQFSSKDIKFFTTMASMSISERTNYFKKKNNIGTKSVEEIVYRTQIVIDYYGKRTKDLAEDNREYTIEELLKEYNKLKEYSQQLTDIIDIMQTLLKENGIDTSEISIPKRRFFK